MHASSGFVSCFALLAMGFGEWPGGDLHGLCTIWPLSLQCLFVGYTHKQVQGLLPADSETLWDAGIEPGCLHARRVSYLLCWGSGPWNVLCFAVLGIEPRALHMLGQSPHWPLPLP